MTNLYMKKWNWKCDECKYNLRSKWEKKNTKTKTTTTNKT